MSSADDPASNGALFTVFLALWGMLAAGVAGMVILIAVVKRVHS